MIFGKLNLTALNHALMKSTKSPDETIVCIPVKSNQLFKSDKGNVYLDLVGFPYTPKNEDDKNDHLIKQSFSKEQRDKMTEEQRNSLPILGNFQVGSSGPSESAPNNAAPGEVADAVDDLPF